MKYPLFSLAIMVFIVSMTLCQEEDTTIFAYNFDDETVGEPPSDPWKATPAGEVVVVDFPDQVNKSVKIVDEGSGGGMQLLMDQLLEEKTLSLEFKWLREKWGGADGVEIFYIMNRNCPDDWSGVCLTTQGNSFQYNDSGAWVNVADIEDNVWHDVKFVMYLHNNKYDFYWDGELIEEGAGFRKSVGIAGIDKFNVANFGNGGSTFTMYFDDIILYEGTERDMAVESRNKLAISWGKFKASASSYMEYPGGHKGTRFEKGLPVKARGWQ